MSSQFFEIHDASGCTDDLFSIFAANVRDAQLARSVRRKTAQVDTQLKLKLVPALRGAAGLWRSASKRSDCWKG